MIYIRTASVLLATVMATLAMASLVLALTAAVTAYLFISRNRTLVASVLGVIVLVLFIVVVLTRT